MPSQLAINSYDDNPQIQSGQITAIDGERYHLRINSDCYCANKAFSCVIRPQVGDIVQVIFRVDEVFITHILLRKMPTTMQIDLPENTDIYAKGKINFQATEISQKSIHYEVIAQQVKLTAEALEIFSQHLYQFSEFSHIKTEQLLKEVKTFEQSVTKQLRMIVHDHWRVDSHSTHMRSEKDTTIDARTIALG